LRDTSTFTLHDHQRMARAFLALGDDAAPEALQRSATKVLAAFAAVLVLALGAPMTWMAPALSIDPGKVGDQPAATLSNSKAALAAADDEDGDGGD
jgi:hypothetical protein